jgi:general stress protein YciG
MPTTTQSKGKGKTSKSGKRGVAAMNSQQQQTIANKGGKTSRGGRASRSK